MSGSKHIASFELRGVHPEKRRDADEILLSDVDVPVSVAASNAARLALKPETFVHDKSLSNWIMPMTTDHIVILVMVVLMLGTIASLAVWWRAYRRNAYIERTGHNPDGTTYHVTDD
jgi:hypothetical protein